MQDTQLIGNGASRLLKGPPNAVSLYPDFASWLADFADNGIPCDLSNLQAAGTTTFGTAYSKATCLPDTLETALWGTKGNRTIAQALDKLRTMVNTAQTTANAVSDCLVMEHGSYVAGGESKYTVTLNFSIKWEVLFFIPSGSHYFAIAVKNGQKIIGRAFSSSSIVLGSCDATDYTFSYSGNVNSIPWINENGATYYYTAIGIK